MNSAGILLDSTSLSEYMLDLGEPVTAKKSRKDDEDEVELPSVKPINIDMIIEKMKYEDIPMGCAITAQIISALVVGEGADVTYSLVYLVITLLSIFVSFLISSQERDNKIIDTNTIVMTVQGRINDYHIREAQKKIQKV